MIHASSLRIQNWIIYREKWHQVFGIIPSGNFGEVILNPNTGQRAGLEEIDPIPLSAELLQKAGFEHVGVQTYLLDLSPSQSLQAMVLPVGKVLFTWGGLNMRRQHLHELQNLYYTIAGNELTISL